MDNKGRERFVKGYFNSNSADGLKLVLSTCDEEPFLYRYRPMTEEYDFESLIKCYFWQQTLDCQNDEQEGITSLNSVSLRKWLRKLFPMTPNSMIDTVVLTMSNKVEKELKAFRKKYGVVCFSESPSCPTMWEKYASQYQGVCIAYSKKKLVDVQFHMVPVLYQKLKSVDDFFAFRGNSIEQIDIQIEKVFLTKTLEWAYEHEWRHIGDISDGNRTPAVTPEKIYIGHKCSNANRNRIMEYCKNHNIAFTVQNKI